MKFGTGTVCNVTRKRQKKNQNCSYRDDDVIYYVNFFEKLYKK